MCPVKINIHKQIFAWRKVIAEKGELPAIKSVMMKAAGMILAHPRLYRLAISSAGMALRHLPHFVVYNRLNTWTRGREMPQAPRKTFQAWWAKIVAGMVLMEQNDDRSRSHPHSDRAEPTIGRSPLTSNPRFSQPEESGRLSTFLPNLTAMGGDVLPAHLRRIPSSWFERNSAAP